MRYGVELHDLIRQQRLSRPAAISTRYYLPVLNRLLSGAVRCWAVPSTLRRRLTSDSHRQPLTIGVLPYCPVARVAIALQARSGITPRVIQKADLYGRTADTSWRQI